MTHKVEKSIQKQLKVMKRVEKDISRKSLASQSGSKEAQKAEAIRRAFEEQEKNGESLLRAENSLQTTSTSSTSRKIFRPSSKNFETNCWY